MDIYIIPPNKYLELSDSGDRFFCLAQHYLKNEQYRTFFQQRAQHGAWVTLDCGIGDHDPVTQDVLFDVMRDLKPSEVIPVDTLFDINSTLSNLEDYITKQQRIGDRTPIFACPQGKNKTEWIDCYKQMLYHPFVQTIGMSKLSVPKAFLNATGDQEIARARNLAYDYLVSNDLLQKPLHFLGMGDPHEFDHYDLNNPLLRSTDSCNTIWSAMNGFSWVDQNFTRIKTPSDYFERELRPWQKMLLMENIDYFKKIVNK